VCGWWRTTADCYQSSSSKPRPKTRHIFTCIRNEAKAEV
jgi:hypothetical protein